VVLDRAPVDYPPLTRTADLIKVRGRRRSPPIGKRMIRTSVHGLMTEGAAVLHPPWPPAKARPYRRRER
jgi:hypothetical protein